MICANPDLVVHRGHKLVYCAGALAEVYESLGGETIYAGKPHRPIYKAALERIAALRGAPVAPARALAIGDALRTDLAGAVAAGLDALFVADGIHRGELYGPGAPDDALQRLFAPPAPRPVAAIRVLVP
jgi:HAD superfamily hydrolase (TIGR01459 family)